jgi:hypothetical protein
VFSSNSWILKLGCATSSADINPLGVLFLSLVLDACSSMSDQDRALFHSLTGPNSGVNAFVALHDTALANNLAFTTADRNNIYMDFEKLRKTPHTKWNILRHEIAHAKGANHGDGSPEMNYVATETMAGDVVDDTFFI